MILKLFITIKGTEVILNLHNSPKTQPHTPRGITTQVHSIGKQRKAHLCYTPEHQ